MLKLDEPSKKDLNADINRISQGMDTIVEVDKALEHRALLSSANTQDQNNQTQTGGQIIVEQNYDLMSEKGANVTTANREEQKSIGGFDVLSRNTGGFDTSVYSKQSRIKQKIIQAVFNLIEKIKE